MKIDQKTLDLFKKKLNQVLDVVKTTSETVEAGEKLYEKGKKLKKETKEFLGI